MILLRRQPLSAYGLVPSDLVNWLTAARALRETGSVAGRTGVVVGAKRATAPRRVQVGVIALLTSELDRLAVMARVERSLLDQRLPLETVDRQGVQTWVLCESIEWREVQPNAPKIAVASIAATLTFVALDGGSDDIEPSAPVLLSTTPAALSVGTLPSDGVIWLSDITNPCVVTYTPADGQSALALSVAVTQATGDTVALDLATAEAWSTTAAGLRTRVTSSVTGTWFTIDPADARGLGLLDGTSAIVRPTVALSSGAGLWLGRRRWRV